jgi:hypothetical protein
MFSAWHHRHRAGAASTLDLAARGCARGTGASQRLTVLSSPYCHNVFERWNYEGEEAHFIVSPTYFSLHIEGDVARDHSVPEVVLIEILENARRVFELVDVHVEGGDVEKRT